MDDDPTLTHTGQIMGTPDYISPEQARESHDADIRSDIYSLGCTLYRCITGQPPFKGNSPVAKITARMVEEPTPIASLHPDLPAGLADVIHKSLSRDPATRFQTPDEFRQALQTFAETESSELIAAMDAVSKSSESATIAETDTKSRMADVNTFDDFMTSLATEARIEEPPAAIPIAQPVSDAPTFLLTNDQGGPRSMTDIGLKIAKQRNKGRRRLIWGTVTFALAALIVGIYVVWQRVNETVVVIDWPENDRKSGKIVIDGIEIKVPLKGELEFRSSKLNRSVELKRKGFKTVEHEWTLTAGEQTKITPEWKPTLATIRDREWRTIVADVDAVVNKAKKNGLPDDFTTSFEIKHRLDAYAKRWPKTVERVKEVGLLIARVPMPLDKLSGTEIPESKSALATSSDAIQLPPEVVHIVGDGRLRHWGVVTAVSISPEGDRIASGGNDGIVRIWDSRSGAVRGSLSTSRSSISDISFSHDGNELVVATRGNAATSLWRIDADSLTKQNVRLPRASSAQFIDDAGLLLLGETGEGGGGIELWDANSGTLRREFMQEDNHSVFALALSPDSRMIASVTNPDWIRIWRTETGEKVADIKHYNGSTGIQFTPDQSKLINVGGGQGWQVYDIKTRKQLRELSASDRLVDLAIGPAGTSLYTLTSNSGIHQAANASYGPDVSNSGFQRSFVWI